MERVRLIYEQAEEAKRLLVTGSLLNLRIALILLDNVAELLMYRELERTFAYFDQFKYTRELAARDAIHESMIPPYTEDERKEAQREFDPKIRILGHRLKKLPHDDGQILRVCHRFRTETFHREELRSEILLPITTLLLHTVANLTVTLPPGLYVLRGRPGVEDVAFLNRFGFDEAQALSLNTPESLNQLREKLTEGLPLDSPAIADTLSHDLVERIENSIGNLMEIDSPKNEDEADDRLQHSQFWQEVGAELAKQGVKEPRLTEEYKTWKAAGQARFTFAKLRLWQKRAALIQRQGNVARALELYSAIDRRFVPFEEYAAEALFHWEEYIDMRIKDGW